MPRWELRDLLLLELIHAVLHYAESRLTGFLVGKSQDILLAHDGDSTWQPVVGDSIVFTISLQLFAVSF